MCNRDFLLGDRIKCNISGVTGMAIRFYTPTACEEQTAVRTDDGREYHAPTSTWKRVIVNILEDMTLEAPYIGDASISLSADYIRSGTIAIPGPQSISLCSGHKEVIRLEPNGNIFVKGNLVENDIEVVNGMRDLLKIGGRR